MDRENHLGASGKGNSHGRVFDSVEGEVPYVSCPMGQEGQKILLLRSSQFRYTRAVCGQGWFSDRFSIVGTLLGLACCPLTDNDRILVSLPLLLDL